LNSEYTGYRNYLCFTVTKQTNNPHHLQHYSDRQQEIHDLILSLHSKGLGYRKIAHHLNEQDIKTERGKTCKNTTVYSVLKRFKQRESRINDVRDMNYEVNVSSMRVEYL
jgi:hypothetical protein